jgi:hypothetical protein
MFKRNLVALALASASRAAAAARLDQAVLRAPADARVLARQQRPRAVRRTPCSAPLVHAGAARGGARRAGRRGGAE